MSRIAKVRLVLIFTMVFITFMFGGLYNPRPVMAAPPTFQAAGLVSAGPGGITVAWPAHQAGDIALLLIETANEVVTFTTPAGFVAVANSPQGTGTAAGTAATRLSVFWARATSAAMTSPVLPDNGNHQIGQIITFRGVVATGNPWDVTAGAVLATSNTAVSIPTVTTTVADTLVVTIVSNATDTATLQTSGWTNANLTGLTEIADSNSTTGNGGGFGAAAGVKAAAGATGATTATLATSSVQGLMTIALMPPTPPSVTINQAAGQADPTGSTPINFTIVFSEAINPATFTGSDVTITGTAGATAVTLTTSDNITWNAAVSGLTSAGTVIASIAANAVQDMAGENNTASTSTDNTVTWTLQASTTSCTNGGKDGPVTISGIVNTYYPGNGSPAAGATSIPVGTPDARGSGTAISTGDLLLVMQMQDADINASNTSAYGDGLNAGSGYTALNQSGLYEYVTATGPVAAGSVPIQGAGTGNGLFNSYRTRAYVAGTNGQSTFQVIRIPQYSAATIAAATTVAAPAWNGSTGGVVVMDVAGTLSIDGTVDVNGLGFRGGMGRQLAGGAGANTDYRTLATNTANASKGEGVAGTPRYMNRPATFDGAPVQVDTTIEGYPNGSYGRGAPGNAGGGGTDGNIAANDQNSGGGGGANYGSGGKGGHSWFSFLPVGGEGGSYITGLAYNRVVMGGGGGAGTTNNGTGENFTFTDPAGIACTSANGACSSGAPGGGLVILRAKLFAGSGSVSARGGSAYNVAQDSGGGGGAGGSIILYSQLGGTVNAYVDGGNGGNAWRNGASALADRHGPGGGGGGGFLAYSPQTGFAVNASFAGGLSGKTTTLNDNYGSTSADGGIYIFDYPIIPGLLSGADCLPALTISKATTTPSIAGLPGTATYAISVTNSGNATAEQVVISDSLPGVPALFTNATAAPTIAYNPNSAPCNTSRTSTTDAATGISDPAWSNWDIPAGCAVSLTFNVTVPAGTVPTTYQNAATATYLDPERTTPTGTRSVTYNPGSSTAEDVNVLAPPSLSEAFGAASILAGGSTTLTMTLTNPNAAAITALGFTNTLPTAAAGAPGNMTIVNTGLPGDDPTTTCGGAPIFTAVDGSGTFTVSGLTIPANSTCTVTITVTAPTNGIYVNTIPAGAISSSAGTNTGPATASLLVGNVANPNVLMPPTMTKSFLTNPFLTGGTSVLRFILTNPNPARPVGSAGFIDTLPTGLVIASPNGLANGCGGTVTATAGTNYVSLNTDGTIPAGGTCTVDVTITARYPGIYQNISGQVVGDTGTGNRASDTLRVMAPLVVDKDFVTNPVAIATATVLRITLTNPNSIAVTGAALTDTYPTGLVNTGTPSPATTCPGTPTLTAAAGGSSITVGGTGANIPANSSCTITVNVQSASGGSYTNSTGPVTTTNAGTAPSASSTLNVLSPPQVRKVFSPDIMSNGGQSGMQIVISNPSSNTATLTGVALSDTYTGNMTNAATGAVLCTEGSSATLTGGINGGTTVGISGGSILPGGSCMITQLVTASTNNTNTTSAPTSTNAGTGSAVTAVLKVMQPLLVAKSFSNAHPAVGANVTMTIALTNPNPAAVKNIAFLDTYPANLVNAAAPAPTFTPAGCAGTGAVLTAVAAGNTLTLTNGTLAANTTCSMTVVVTMNLNNISRINNTGNITTANAGTSPGDSATISTGTGIAPVELAKTFTPDTITVGANSTLQFTITNPVGGAVPANTIAFSDTLPAGLVIATPNGLTNTCGGVVTATAGTSSVSLAGGAIATAAPTNCTISVTVTGVAAGPYVNRTGQITQAGGIVGNYAEAAIEVKTAPSVSKSFGAAYLTPGATTQLTVRIDNPNSTAITTSANFDDVFPTTPGAMTLADGIVSNNTCSLPVQDSNGATLISSATVDVGTDFSTANVAAVAPGTNPTTTLTGTYTVGPGTNKLLLVAVELETAAAGDTVTFNSATYGGQNLTSLVMAGATFRNRIWVGYLNEAGISAATGTTLSVTLNTSANPAAAILKAAYFTSVNQTTPIYHNVSNFNDTAAATFNFGGTPLNVVQNGRAIYFAAFNNGPTATPAPGFTELFDQADPSGNFSTEGASRAIATTTTDSGTNITLTAAQRYGVVALTLNPNTYTGTLPGGVRVPGGTSIPAGGCEFTVSVTASAAGTYTNTITAGALQTDAGNNATAASAALVIPNLGPLVTEVFVPAAINAGGTSRLVMTFENPNAIPISLTSLFTNTLPTGVVLAGTPNIVTTCAGGTTGGAAGGSTVTLSSGAVIPAGSFELPGSCTLSVDVTAAAAGIYTDTIPAGDLQTTAGSNTDPASAVLTVLQTSPPTVSKAFGDVSIGDSGVASRLTITLSNTNTTAATLSANLVDTLPANLVVATPNGLSGTCTLGSVTATAGGSTITYASGATIPAGGCTIVVNVTSTIVAVYTNTIAAGDLQTDLGNNPGPTSDTLFVVPTLVTLSDFSAYNDNGRIVVTWSTSSEMDTAGFYLFRLDEKPGRYRQINGSILPALITSPQGGSYSLIDNGASLTGSNTYLLMEVEGKGGRNTYGPFTVIAGAGNALESQYSSAPKAAGALLSSSPGSAGPQSRSITKYVDREGTIVIAAGNVSSPGAGSLVTNEASDFTRTAKAIPGDKQAALALRAEAKATAGILKKQKSGNRVKIAISKDGLYYMDSAEISSLLGLADPWVRQMIRSGRLALTNQGNDVAYVPAEDMSGLFFYGQGMDSIYTAENIYWLSRGEGLQMAGMEGSGPAPDASGIFSETIHAEQDRTVAPALASGPASDYWFWDYVIAGNPSLGRKLFDLQVFGIADSSSMATLTAALHGATATGVPDEHHVSISLNGTVIGEDRWKGIGKHFVNLSFSQALLAEGTNTIEVKGLLNSGVPYSIFFVDSFDLTYQRLWEAHNNSLTFRAEGAQPLTVYGFTSPDLFVFDITDPDKPVLNGATTIDSSDGSYSISFSPSAGSRYLAVAADAAAPVDAVADSPSALSSIKNVADYLIITTKELVAAAQELAAYRQGQGLKTMVVDLEDIMDEFNHGIANPEAIRLFLTHATTRWKKGPKYVLLAGDGTYDYKDNMGVGDNLVPTLMAETPQVISPSDNLYADLDGDHIPDIAIGRLPVLTAEELRSVIAKIITYESTAGNHVIMLADNQDTGGKFPADSDDIAALVPRGYSVSRIYLSGNTVAEARQLLFHEIETGAILMNYTGHAGVDLLAGEGLLRVSDMSTLQNSANPFVLAAMTCTVGNFALPGFDSLSEALVTKDRGGAVAVWAPTGLSYNYLSKVLDEHLFRDGLGHQGVTLGDVIIKAFRNYQAAGRPAYIMDIFNLQGDPALRLW